MSLESQIANPRKRSLYSLVGAFLTAVLIFLIIPLTQKRAPQTNKVVDIRKVALLQPPAPSEPPNITQKPMTEKSAPKPAFNKQPAAPEPRQLGLSLNPGIDEALAIGTAGAGFELTTDAVGDIEKLFTFNDLPEAPRIINYPRIQFPQELVRRGITQGRVIALIEIDERGRAEIIAIESSTHPLLIKKAEEVIRQAQFTQPLVDGVPQRVRGEWPIDLREPK